MTLCSSTPTTSATLESLAPLHQCVGSHDVFRQHKPDLASCSPARYGAFISSALRHRQKQNSHGQYPDRVDREAFQLHRPHCFLKQLPVCELIDAIAQVIIPRNWKSDFSVLHQLAVHQHWLRGVADALAMYIALSLRLFSFRALISL